MEGRFSAVAIILQTSSSVIFVGVMKFCSSDGVWIGVRVSEPLLSLLGFSGDKREDAGGGALMKPNPYYCLRIETNPATRLRVVLFNTLI